METVLAGCILFVPFVWNCIHEVFSRHCLVPCCIHNCCMRNIRHNLLCSFDTHDVCRHVERSKIYYFLESCKNFWSYENRLCELFSTMENTVTNGSDFAEVRDNACFLVCDHLEDEFDCFLVCWTWAFKFYLVSLCLVCDA